MSDDPYKAFAEGINALSEQTGIGIEGGVLYNRMPEDMMFRYVCDDEGRLVRS